MQINKLVRLIVGQFWGGKKERERRLAADHVPEERYLEKDEDEINPRGDGDDLATRPHHLS